MICLTLVGIHQSALSEASDVAPAEDAQRHRSFLLMRVRSALQITSNRTFNTRCGGKHEEEEGVEDGMWFRGEGKVEDD